MVELEVAHVNDQAGCGSDAQRDTIRNGVANVDILDGERSQFGGVAGLYGLDLHLVLHIVACQLGFDQAACQGSGVNRRVDIVGQVLNRADMVLVPVGDEDAEHLARAFAQILEVRDDVIDPEHVVVREHDPRVDNNDLPTKFVGHHVLSHFTEPPERDNS